MALDVIYARRQGFLDASSAERVLSLLEQVGFELFAQELLATDSNQELLVWGGLEEFREHLGGRLSITLLERIGSGFEVHDMSARTVRDSISELQERHSARALLSQSHS